MKAVLMILRAFKPCYFPQKAVIAFWVFIAYKKQPFYFLGVLLLATSMA
jgi:hypothetical protein